MDNFNNIFNDILSNPEKNTNDTFYDNFYNIFKRHLCLQTNEEIDKYVYNLEKKEVVTQINIFLGLLTVKERNDIIINFPIINDT